MKNIRHIIFDLGNVIIDLDIPLTSQRFAELLGDQYAEVLEKAQAQHIFEHYETGDISEKEFVSTLQSIAHRPVSEQAIMDAWNAMLIGIPPIRFELLERLRRKYGVYLLSNTNSTHLQWVYEYLRREHRIYDFDNRFFDKSWYSHLIGLRKPNADIFEFVLQDAGLNPAETLFIDDNPDNIKGAQSVGIQTILHPPGMEIASIPFFKQS